MGQYANQPDFITNDIQAVTPVLAANLTAADSLNGSVLYIGTSAPGNIQVIPAGTVGPSVISGFSSPGYTGSGGTGYAAANNVATTTTGAGTNLTVNTTVVGGVVTSIVIGNNAGTGYLNGDLITVTGGDANAVFRVVAAPGLPGAAQAQVFTNVPQGEWFPVVVDYVLSDATTVSNIVAGK